MDAADQLEDAEEGSEPSEIEIEVELVTRERFILLRTLALAAKQILASQSNDAYLEFHSLTLLHNLFEKVMPLPTYQNEILRFRGMSYFQGGRPPRTQDIFDLLDETNFPVEEVPEMEVIDLQYLNMRLFYVLQIWDHIVAALNSSWANIRQICFSLVCSMLRIDVRDYNPALTKKIKQHIFPVISKLLSATESESKGGGVNMIGALCGLGFDFVGAADKHTVYKISENQGFLRKNSDFISLAIWQQVMELQDDWDSTISDAARVLTQICAPRDSVELFTRIQKEKYQMNLSQPFMNFERMSTLGGAQRSLQMRLEAMQNNNEEESNSSVDSPRQLVDDQLIDLVCIFRNDFKPPKSLWIEKTALPDIHTFGEEQALLVHKFNEKVDFPFSQPDPSSAAEPATLGQIKEAENSPASKPG